MKSQTSKHSVIQYSNVIALVAANQPLILLRTVRSQSEGFTNATGSSDTKEEELSWTGTCLGLDCPREVRASQRTHTHTHTPTLKHKRATSSQLSPPPQHSTTMKIHEQHLKWRGKSHPLRSLFPKNCQRNSFISHESPNWIFPQISKLRLISRENSFVDSDSTSFEF